MMKYFRAVKSCWPVTTAKYPVAIILKAEVASSSRNCHPTWRSFPTQTNFEYSNKMIFSHSVRQFVFSRNWRHSPLSDTTIKILLWRVPSNTRQAWLLMWHWTAASPRRVIRHTGSQGFFPLPGYVNMAPPVPLLAGGWLRFSHNSLLSSSPFGAVSPPAGS